MISNGIGVKMNKLNVHKVGLSLAIVSGISYLVCALLFALFPTQTLEVIDNIFHGISIKSLAEKSVSLAGIAIGLVEIAVVAYLLGALFAWVYNYLPEK